MRRQILSGLPAKRIEPERNGRLACGRSRCRGGLARRCGVVHDVPDPSPRVSPGIQRLAARSAVADRAAGDVSNRPHVRGRKWRVRGAGPGAALLKELAVPVRGVGRTALSNYILQSVIGTTL